MIPNENPQSKAGKLHDFRYNAVGRPENMTPMKSLRAGVAILPAMVLPPPGLVFAQGAASYPEKPVRVISALATGGAVDTVGRIVAAKLSDNLRRQFVVENRLGGGGTIGYTYVAKARADGYTLLVA